MHDKVYLDSVRLVHIKSTFAIAAVAGHMECVKNVLQRKKFGDSVRSIKANVSVVLDMSLHVGGESSTISMNSHRFFVCFLYSRGELAFAEQINRELIIKEEHGAEIDGS